VDSSEAGRRLGQITSAAKAQSSRANGRLGGRPVGTKAVESDAVKQIRLKRKWTQRDMALALDCSVSAVQRMERLGVLPQHETILGALRKLADESGVGLPV
jgi:ribosome-binding protein aMBF1 (putative translation factor)